MDFPFDGVTHGVNSFRHPIDLVETVHPLAACAHLEVERDAAKAIAEFEFDVAPVPRLILVIIGNAGGVFDDADDESRILRIAVEKFADAYTIFCTPVSSHTFPF